MKLLLTFSRSNVGHLVVMWVGVTISWVVLLNHCSGKRVTIGEWGGKVLKACNENAKGINKLSDTMASFVKDILKEGCH